MTLTHGLILTLYQEQIEVIVQALLDLLDNHRVQDGLTDEQMEYANNLLDYLKDFLNDNFYSVRFSD